MSNTPREAIVLSRALARLRLPDGRRIDVGPGDILGRLATATGRITDPRVSEAHALISLRGNELQLVSLRGRLEVDDVDDDEVPLVAGQRIRLGGAVELRVEEVQLPDHLLAVSLPGAPPRQLWASVYTVIPPSSVERHHDLVPAYLADGVAHIWSTAEGWSIQLPGQPAEALRPGRRWSLGGGAGEGGQLEALAVPLSAASAEATYGPGRLPLTIVARHDTVHLLWPRRPPAVLDGLPARVLSEVATMGVPVDWRVVAAEIWPEMTDAVRLRKSWDRALERLRARLRTLGVRQDLFRTDGRGNVEVLLLPGDVVRDET